MPGFTDKTWKGSRNCLLNSSLSSFSSGRSNSINYSYSDAIRYRSHPNICEIANLSRRASDSNGVLKMDELLSNNLVLDEDQTYKAYVSHVVENEPYTFYLQLGNSQEILIPSIKRSLEDSPRKPVSGMVFPGMCLMGSLTINSELRRCIITEVYNYGCKVFFCDYGSTGEIPFTHLYHVSHEATQIKPQALKFTLANTASLPDDPKTFDYLKNVLLGAQVQITIVGPTSHPILFCDMEFKGCDVKELILSYLAPLYYLPQILPSSDDTKVFVTHVESASKFFVQYASKLKLIESIQHSLNEIYSNSVDEGGPSSISIGSPVAVFDDEENCWARGLISEMMANFFHVLKVDFGNTIKVERHYIRDIRKRSLVENFRCQTIECGLYDFEEDNCDLIWNNVISKLVPKNFYKMIVLAAKPHHLSVDLLDEKGESITKKIKVAHKQAINGHGVASSDVQAKEVKLSVQEAVHQPMVPNFLNYKLLDLKKGDNMVCYFVTLISPNEIYVQPANSETDLNNIGKIIRSVSLTKLPSDQVSLYRPVVSLFPDDGNFYRGIITNIDDNQVLVTFVDYGNANSVDKSELYVLPDELKQISPQAVNVRFQNLPEVGDSEDLMKYQAIYEGLDVINLQIKSVEVSQGGLVVYADAPREVVTLFQTPSETDEIVENGYEARTTVHQQIARPPTEPDVLSYKLLELKKGDNMVCYFVTLISHNEIYVQPSDSETDLNNIGEIIRSVTLSKLPSDQVSLYKPVVSLFPDDGNFYRGIITNIDDNQVIVTFVDYGNANSVDKSELFVLPDELKQISPQAVNVRFQNLPEVGDSEDLMKYQAIYEGLDALNLQIKSVEVREGSLVVYADAPREIITHFQTPSETGETIEIGHDAPASTVEQQIVHHLTEPDVLSYKLLDLKKGDNMVCYFVTLISPNEIYVQPSNSETDLNNIGEIISSISLSKLPSGQLSLYKPVVSLFADDGNFYRGIITNIDDNQVTVIYVDYGNANIVDKSELYALPDELKQISPQAVIVRFQNLPEVGDSEDLVKYQAIYEGLDAINVQINSVEVSEGGLVVYADAPHEVFTLFQTPSETGETIKIGHDAPASTVEQQIVHHLTEPDVLSYKLLDLKKGDNMVCYFVTLISPKEIYVQPSDSETDLNNIGEIIRSVTLSKLPSDQVSLYKPVVSLFPDDGNFYRGIITNIDDNQVIVTFVDYGNANSVDKSELYVLPDELKQISPQAVNVRFQNLPEVGDSEDLMKYQAIYEGLDVINLQIKSVEVSQGGLVVYTDAPEEILSNFQTSDIKVPTVPAPYLVKEDPFALSHDDLGAEKFDDIESFSEEDEIDNVTVKELGSNASTTGIYLDSSNLEFSTFTENLDLLRGQTFLVTLLSSVGDISFIVKIHAIDLIMLVDPVCYHPVSVQFIIHVLDVKESRLVVDVYDVVGKHLGKGASISPIIPRPIVKREDIVFVSHYEGETIYITRVEDREKLDCLLNETYQYYDNTPELDIDWKIGAICCAKSSDDNWYRAKILESYGSDFKVKFIDYGNSELVPKTNLRELSHRFFCEPELCVEIKLPIVLNENAEYDSSITNGTFKTLFYKKEGATWICDLTQDDEKLSSKLGTNMKCFRPEYLPERMPVGWNFQVSDSHKAYVTTVHSIDSFYVQLEADIPRLHMFQRVVNNFNDAGPIEQVFAALYSGDGSWYRAVDVPNGIRFIDYGNVETTNQKKSIPYECTFPAEGLALLVNLCVKPINQIWSSEAIKIFNQFIENRVEIKILSLLGRVVVDVISVSDSNSLSGILINSGYAKFTDYMPETISDLIQRRSEIINNSLTLINRSLPENELIGTKNPAFISFMLTVNDFYIQYIKQLEILERLKKMLIHAQHFDSVKNFNVGDILCVQHVDLGHEGKVWYRGKIISKDPLQALLLDYGLTVNVSDVRLLPLEIHNVPQLAVHCSLNLKIHPANDPLILQNHEIMLKLCQENLIVDFLTDGKPHIVSLKDSDDIEVFFNV